MKMKPDFMEFLNNPDVPFPARRKETHLQDGSTQISGGVAAAQADSVPSQQ